MASHREFNPPAQMLERLAFAAHLGFAICGVALAVGACVDGRADLGVGALLAFSTAFALRVFLRRRNAFEACRDSFDAVFEGEVPGGPGRDDPRLEALLDRRAAIESQRGSRSFDPWELLALQHDIEAHLREHPRAAEKPRDGAM